MRIEKVKQGDSILRFFAEVVVEFAENNGLNYVLFIAIPVEGHDYLSSTVIQRNLAFSKEYLSESKLSEITNHSSPFWSENTISYNMGYPSPFKHTDIEFQEADVRLSEESNVSVIHRCFYTAL